MLKYIITGTGRSGTGFYSNLFSSAGVPCTHEEIFMPLSWEGIVENKNKADRESGGIDIAESSWMAAPFLGKEIFKDTIIIHQVRHPVATINSLLNIGVLGHSKEKRGHSYTMFAKKYIPEVFEFEEELDRAVYFYIYWNEMIEKYSDFLIRIEDNAPKIFRSLKINVKKEDLYKHRSYNSRKNERLFWSYKKISNKNLRDALLGKGAEYGYW